MDTSVATRRLASVAAGATAIVVAGCSGIAPPARELPRCHQPETLVCYGKTATRLENRDRLEDVEFCRCERVIF